MLKISGSSDDLIEVEGDINEEFPHAYASDRVSYLALSNGMVVHVYFNGDSGWVTKVIYSLDDNYTYGYDSYGDQYVVTPDEIEWVVGGSSLVSRNYK